MAIETNWMRWSRYVAHTRELRNSYKGLVEISEYKIPSGGRTRRCDYNIKVQLLERYEGLIRIHLAQDI
jgi:hypothetical protein